MCIRDRVNSDEGLNVLFKKTLELLGNGEQELSKDTLTKASITVANVERVMVDGNTLYYIESSDGAIYKIAFTTKLEDALIFLKAGDVLDIEYIDTEGIKTIKTIQ